MEKYYKISETELKELLAAQLELIALENGGVDNCEWYGYSIHNWFERVNDAEGKHYESFYDAAEDILNDYDEVE